MSILTDSQVVLEVWMRTLGQLHFLTIFSISVHIALKRGIIRAVIGDGELMHILLHDHRSRTSYHHKDLLVHGVLNPCYAVMIEKDREKDKGKEKEKGKPA